MDIAVGLSGGVDSSVAAAVLKEQGHNVSAVTMRIFEGQDAEFEAAEVASFLKIPHYVIDLVKEYKENIISYIQNEYQTGRTPNPCAVCNEAIKFGLFLEKAEEVLESFDLFATGHYSKLVQKDGFYTVSISADTLKDQTYFLARLKQNQFKKILFPLAEMKKQEVRQIAEETGLFTSKKKDSQDLCAGNYRKYLLPRKKAGNIISPAGEILGKHEGIENYTLGQRRGLGISSPEPIYVVGINAENNTVTAGPENLLLADSLTANSMNWILGDQPEKNKEYNVKIRYRDSGKPAVIKKEGSNWNIIFDTPRRAITPGQLAVCYDGNILAGSFFIK